MTDRLPKSNYDSIKSSDGLLRDRRAPKEEGRERQSKIVFYIGTLPKLDGILRYHEDLIKKKERDGQRGGGMKRPKNNSLQIEGVSKLLANDIKIDLRK